MPARPQTQPAADFPISFQAFATTLVGTADEVWITLLRAHHQNSKLTGPDWVKALEKLKAT